LNSKYHFYLPEESELRSILTSEIVNAFCTYGFEALKKDLWALIKAITHDQIKEEQRPDFSELLVTLVKIVEGAWQFLEYKKRYQFEHSSLNIKYAKNPYCQQNDREEHAEKKLDHLSPFGGELALLSKEEVRDFTVALEDFFSVMGVLDWKRLLKNWIKLFDDEDDFVECFGDDIPLIIYEYLMKLIETAYLINYWYETESLPEPNAHLFETDYIIFEMNPKDDENYNPLLEINWMFEEYNATILKQEINDWFACSEEIGRFWEKGEPADLIRIHDGVVRLLEAGWLLTQCDELPLSWLDPNSFDCFSQPKPEEYALSGVIQYLTKAQCDNIYLTLSELYNGSSIGYRRDSLRNRLFCALQTKIRYLFCSDIKEVIMPIIEVLYLINLEVCSRRNK